MSYWFERQKLRVGKERDKRIKVSDEDKEMIKYLYSIGYSIRKIAKMYSHLCTRRNIQFILFPERAKRIYEYRRLRNWDYDKERHKIYVKRYREHLKEIYGLKRPRISKIKNQC
jgi:hypothetical protein